MHAAQAYIFNLHDKDIATVPLWLHPGVHAPTKYQLYNMWCCTGSMPWFNKLCI